MKYYIEDLSNGFSEIFFSINTHRTINGIMTHPANPYNNNTRSVVNAVKYLTDLISIVITGFYFCSNLPPPGYSWQHLLIDNMGIINLTSSVRKDEPESRTIFNPAINAITTIVSPDDLSTDIQTESKT